MLSVARFNKNSVMPVQQFWNLQNSGLSPHSKQAGQNIYPGEGGDDGVGRGGIGVKYRGNFSHGAV